MIRFRSDPESERAVPRTARLCYTMSAMKTWLAFWFGIFKNNPIFRLVLGLCPTLAVTTSLENALGMGLAASFVLICSNGLVSALRRVIPDAVHIPCYIVIIATFVTTVNLLMQAFLPGLSEKLGIFRKDPLHLLRRMPHV